jgi:hypothetical protein
MATREPFTFPSQRRYTTKLPVHLSAVQAMLTVALQQPPAEASLAEKGAFYKDVTKRLRRMAYRLGADGRERMETALFAWFDDAEVDPGLREDLTVSVAPFLASTVNLSEVSDPLPVPLAVLKMQATEVVPGSDDDYPLELYSKNDVPEGFAGVPHSFAKSSLFSESTKAALMVLGFTNIVIEHVTAPLNQDHLHVLTTS